MRTITAVLLLALAHPAGAQPSHCPIPDIGLHVAAEGTADDAVLGEAVLATLAEAAARDAARAGTDPLAVGAELATLQQSPEDLRMVSARVGSLARRLWQLDCAVWRGQARDAARLYRDISAAIASLRATSTPWSSLETQRGWRLPPPALLIAPAPLPVDHRRRARRYALGSALAAVAGLALIGGAIDLTIGVVNYQPPPPCPPKAFLCLDGLSEGFHQIDVFAMGLLWAFGGATIVTSVVLAAMAGHHATRVRVQPLVQLAPTGGSLGVGLTF